MDEEPYWIFEASVCSTDFTIGYLRQKNTLMLYISENTETISSKISLSPL